MCDEREPPIDETVRGGRIGGVDGVLVKSTGQPWRIARVLALWAIAVVIAFLVVFAISRALGSWLGADATAVDVGVISTFTGVVGAVPIALLIGRLADRGSRADREAEAEDRRVRLLETLTTDLEEILAEIDIHAADRESGPIVPYLRTDVWRAMSAGDQLQLVKDPDLLGTLARAYHRVETTADLERQYWRAYHDPAYSAHRVDRTTGEDTSLRHLTWIVAAVVDQDRHTRAAVDVGLSRLRQELRRPPQSV